MAPSGKKKPYFGLTGGRLTAALTVSLMTSNPLLPRSNADSYSSSSLAVCDPGHEHLGMNTLEGITNPRPASQVPI